MPALARQALPIVSAASSIPSSDSFPQAARSTHQRLRLAADSGLSSEPCSYRVPAAGRARGNSRGMWGRPPRRATREDAGMMDRGARWIAVVAAVIFATSLGGPALAQKKLEGIPLVW